MLEGIETLRRGQGRARPCAVTRWLNTLDPETRAQAQEVLDDRDIFAPAVHDLFNRNGADIANSQTITRHRSRRCCTRLAD